MSLGRSVGTVLKVLVVLALVTLVVGNVLGQPILLSYVTSDSMEPTLEVGDGFVAVPTAVAGPPAEGDVVVYRSEELRPDQLVTHRVVERRESGYVTKGDGNPFTDQSGVEPLVPPDRIEAVALAYDDEVVVIPELGTGLMALRDGVGTVQQELTHLTGSRGFLGTSGLGYLLLGVGLATIVATALLDGGRRERPVRSRAPSRPTVSTLTVALVLALLVAGPATAWMAVSGGEEAFTFVSSTESSASNPSVVAGGTTTNGTYNLTNRGSFPIVVVLESTHEDLRLSVDRKRLAPGESLDATVTIEVPAEQGYHERSFVERRYFAVMPTDWLVALDGVHPALAVLAVDVLVAVGAVVLVVGLFGRGPMPVRERGRPGRSGSGLLDRLW